MKDYRSFFISGSGYLSARSNFEKNRAKISTVNNIKAEIYARGPVACTIYATDLFDDYTGGIFSQVNYMKRFLLTVLFRKGIGSIQIISSVWLVGERRTESSRISWRIFVLAMLLGIGSEGTVGERIGVKMAFSEFDVPLKSTGWVWTILVPSRIRSFLKICCQKIFFQSSFSILSSPDNAFVLRDVPYAEYLLNYHAKEAKPEAEPFKDRSEFIGNAADAYDIRNIDGKSYASIDRNQNSPKFCESSWAQAAISALNDRFALLRPDAFPEVSLSVQVLFFTSSRMADLTCLRSCSIA